MFCLRFSPLSLSVVCIFCNSGFFSVCFGFVSGVFVVSGFCLFAFVLCGMGFFGGGLGFVLFVLTLIFISLQPLFSLFIFNG